MGLLPLSSFCVGVKQSSEVLRCPGPCTERAGGGLTAGLRYALCNPSTVQSTLGGGEGLSDTTQEDVLEEMRNTLPFCDQQMNRSGEDGHSGDEQTLPSFLVQLLEFLTLLSFALTSPIPRH